jgi:hypothetical protein
MLTRKAKVMGMTMEEMPGVCVAVCFKGRVNATSITSSSALVILIHQVFGMNRSLYDEPSVYVKDSSPGEDTNISCVVLMSFVCTNDASD